MYEFDKIFGKQVFMAFFFFVTNMTLEEVKLFHVEVHLAQKFSKSV